VRLPDRCDQQMVMQAMLDDGVSTRRGIMCSHREDAYRHVPQRQPLPQSERAQDQCILLPLFPDMSDEDQRRVVVALRQACGRR
jgi:perosamine synthetase